MKLLPQNRVGLLLAGLVLATLPVQAAVILGNYNNVVLSTPNSNAIDYLFGKSVGFTMGTASFTLDSVTLPLFVGASSTYYTPKVQLWTSDGANTPGTLIATLNSPTFVTSSQNYQFTPASTITLSAGTSYFVVVTTVETSATKASGFNWKRSGDPGDTNFNSSLNANSTVSASFMNYTQGLNSPDTWATTGTNYPWFDIQGTEVSAVPEPSSFAVLAGASALGFCTRRRRRA